MASVVHERGGIASDFSSQAVSISFSLSVSASHLTRRARQLNRNCVGRTTKDCNNGREEKTIVNRACACICISQLVSEFMFPIHGLSLLGLVQLPESAAPESA
jgi:hypothetical protein